MSQSRTSGKVARVLASVALGLGFGFGALGVGLIPTGATPTAAHMVGAVDVGSVVITNGGSGSGPVFTPFDSVWS
jgi:hypothetical protein